MLTTWKLITLLVAIMVCCQPGSAMADILLSPTDSIATLNRYDSDAPGVSGASGNTRDGSGFAGGLLNIGIDPADGGTNIWYLKPPDQGASAKPPQTIYYDLGSLQTIDKVAIWQTNATSYDSPNDIDVDYATSIGGGGTFDLTDLAATTWTTGFNAAPNTSTGTGQEFSFGSNVSAQYVRLTFNSITDNFDGDHWGINEFAAVQIEVGDTFQFDFNGGNGPVQADFDSMSYPTANDDFTQSQTFNNIFELGDSVTVDFAGNRPRNRSAISGTFASQSNLLRDWYGSEPGATSAGIDLDLTLPAGKYELTTYHHDVDGGGTAQLSITDATGTVNHGSVTETAGASPATIGMFSTLIRSDGINPIELDFTDLSSQFGINGFTLQTVPEPSALLLTLVGMLGLLSRRRRGPVGYASAYRLA